MLHLVLIDIKELAAGASKRLVFYAVQVACAVGNVDSSYLCLESAPFSFKLREGKNEVSEHGP